MKQLQDILYGVGMRSVEGSTNQEISSLLLDSRKVVANSLFVAIKGVELDGHQYINNAIEKGATVIVCEEFPAELIPDITYVQVDDSRKAVAVMAANFYNEPSKELKLIGVTGTNGKTTVVTIAHYLQN